MSLFCFSVRSLEGINFGFVYLIIQRALKAEKRRLSNLDHMVFFIMLVGSTGHISMTYKLVFVLRLFDHVGDTTIVLEISLS